jgi:preprotein translocase subunit SecF
MLVLFALALFGGEMIFSFAIALMVGVGIGTYSSIYVAANILMMLKLGKEDLMPQERESVDQDEVPSWLKDEDSDTEAETEKK